MKQNFPKTPFATRLSGDAKETELRIRNICQGKKKRPPIWVLILVASLALFCGGLVSCQGQKDVLCCGLNAKVVEIDTQQMILYVQDIDGEAFVFGQRCALDCKQAAQDERLIFVDYETEELTNISFYEFQVGDEIIVELYTSQKEGAKDATARAEQVQLGTQRDIGKTTDREDDLAEKLAQSSLEERDYPTNPELTTLLHQTIGSRSLMLVEVKGAPHIAGLDNLVMGVYDEDTQRFVGDTFDIHGDEPGYTSWRGTDGCLYVLWTNTIYYQGDGTSNGLGYFRFDGQTLEPIYVLPTPARSCGNLPDLPETEAILLPVSENAGSYDFWFTRKAWPVDHGFDLYEKNPNWTPGQEDQWIYVGYVPFAVTDHTVTEEAKKLILDYIETTWPIYRTYYLGEEPGAPQLKDQRIDGVFYAGEERTYETTGVAFRVERSYYDDWGSLYPKPFWMPDQSCIYVILSRSMDGETYTDVRGYDTPNSEKSINQMILEVSYDLMDLEVSLWREGYPWPAGPGSEVHFFRDVYDGEAQVEVLEGWEPIYWPGAYWTRQSWDGFSALCYHVGEEPGQPDPDAYSVYTIDTTRTDLQTYRGIRVGSTRAEVLEAYPDLYDTDYWHDTAPDFPGDDYLWYCDNPDGWGAAILFFFEGDTVSQIRLNNMFN